MRRSLFVWAAALVLAAGCGAGVEQAAPPSPSVRDRAGAPTIDNPRDLRPRAQDPCTTLLAPAQLRALGYRRAGVFSTNSLGPTCRWQASGTASQSIEASVVVTRDLFLDTYAARPLKLFRPGRTLGLPSVDSAISEADPVCTTTVGVADGQTLDVTAVRGTYEGERDADSCAISRRAAEEIVSTLPPL